MFRRASALARSAHPGPSLAVTIVALALGAAVGLELWRVALLGAAILVDQLSVGLSNDWIDARRDRAVGRTDKPVAAGEISVVAVRGVAVASALLALALTLPLGPAATLAHTIALASAWSYNAALKNSPVSVLPYAVSFGLLPAIASLARVPPAFPAWWTLLAGAMLGVAAHFANVLPDLDDDRETGIRGIPHRLGLTASLVITWGSLLLGALAIAVGLGATSTAAVGFSGLGVSLLLGSVGLVCGLRVGVGRWLFRLVIVAALVDVAMLVIAGTRLLA
jgi:4-hydroxybenzoate polyprenyltransferase